MGIAVARTPEGYRLAGGPSFCQVANRYLSHLEARVFSPATVRAYAFDLLNFGRFLQERELQHGEVAPSDLFDYLDWQGKRVKSAHEEKVVRLAAHTVAPATLNRRIEPPWV